MPLPWRRASSSGAANRPSWVPAHGWQRGELVIWGAHGGAGTSTLAAWLQPAWDMGAMRPEPDPKYPASVASGRPLVVTCRNTAQAARQATTAVNAVSRQGGHVTVLAVVSDGWPEPAAATCRFRLLEPYAGAVIRIPFIPALRLADDPAGVPLSRRVRRALTQIQALTGRSASTPLNTSGGSPMSVLLSALTLHAAAMARWSGLAAGVPNPAPAAPPGLSGTVNTLLAWWKWAAMVAGVFGLVGCGAMMALGRRNRSSLAADGATGIPWVLAGLTLIALSSGIVGVFL